MHLCYPECAVEELMPRDGLDILYRNPEAVGGVYFISPTQDLINGKYDRRRGMAGETFGICTCREI